MAYGPKPTFKVTCSVGIRHTEPGIITPTSPDPEMKVTEREFGYIAFVNKPDFIEISDHIRDVLGPCFPKNTEIGTKVLMIEEVR